MGLPKFVNELQVTRRVAGQGEVVQVPVVNRCKGRAVTLEQTDSCSNYVDSHAHGCQIKGQLKE